MRRTSVSSTVLRAIGYDAKRKVLEVQFRSGRIYQYFGVPQQVLARLLAAKSIGGYFNRHLRERYEYEEV